MFNWIAHASLFLSFELSAVSGHGVQPLLQVYFVSGAFIELVDGTWPFNAI
jgi:hypothetical protein